MFIGDPMGAHARLEPEFIEVWEPETASASYRWGALRTLELDCPSSRFRLMGRLPDLLAVGFAAVDGAAITSSQADPGRLVLAEFGDVEREWPLDPMESGRYWRPHVMVAREFLVAMQSSPTFRSIVRAPAQVEWWCRERLAA